LPVLRYDKNSRGALAYLALAGEYLRRQSAAPAVGAVAETAPAEVTENSA
jgi:chromosome partitioning protein